MVTATTVLVLAAGGAVAAMSTPAVAAQGCTYYYSRYRPGPEGQTTGSGTFAEGDIDPEGRVCRHGWWVDNAPKKDLDFAPSFPKPRPY